MEWILSLVAFMLGFGIRHLLSGYLVEKGKNLATKEDISEITELVETVKESFTANLELLKWELSKKSNIHRIVAEREVKAIAEISSKLIDLRVSTQSLRPANDRLPEDNPEMKMVFINRIQKWWEYYNEFYLQVERNRIFLPEIFASCLFEITYKFREEGIRFGTDLQFHYNEGFTPEQYFESDKRISELTQLVSTFLFTLRTHYEMEGLFAASTPHPAVAYPKPKDPLAS